MKKRTKLYDRVLTSKHKKHFIERLIASREDNAASEDEVTCEAASEYRPRRNLILDRDRSLRGDVTRMAETFE